MSLILNHTNHNLISFLDNTIILFDLLGLLFIETREVIVYLLKIMNLIKE